VTSKRPAGAEPIEPPEACPDCQSELRKDPDGVYLRCLNPACPAQIKERLRHFASRGAMDIDGLGPAVIEQLTEQGMVASFPDLYDLRAEELAGLERMGRKSAQNLVDALARSKDRPLSRLLNGLGIRHVGSHVAEVLAHAYGDINRLMAASEDELTDIHEVGPEVAKSVRDFFATDENQELIERLRERGVNMEERTAQDEGGGARPFEGKSFVVTGSLQNYTRDTIKTRIKELGGQPKSSVSSKTDFLLAGDEAGSKLKQAQDHGVPVLTEAQFEAIARGEMTPEEAAGGSAA
jgi:DNA ligase (NAD+)